MFQLFLFSKDEDTVRDSVRGGISGFVIDWENRGKAERQSGFNTQINYDTLDDLRRVRALTDALVLCRCNRNINIGEICEEIDLAIQNGADEILLPMVRTVGEVESVLNYVNGRCGVGILIETNAAVAIAEDLGKLPLSRVYVGLNDLAIERDRSNIFEPLIDGTLDTVRKFIAAPFGFAGLTLPQLGYPLPCRLLISEMARLNCSFTFLRRSFLEDVKGRDIASELHVIYEAVENAFLSSDEEKAATRGEARKKISICSDFFEGLRIVPKP